MRVSAHKHTDERIVFGHFLNVCKAHFLTLWICATSSTVLEILKYQISTEGFLNGTIHTLSLHLLALMSLQKCWEMSVFCVVLCPYSGSQWTKVLFGSKRCEKYLLLWDSDWSVRTWGWMFSFLDELYPFRAYIMTAVKIPFLILILQLLNPILTAQCLKIKMLFHINYNLQYYYFKLYFD